MDPGNPIRACDIMHREVISVGEDTDVWELARILAQNRISGAPVVDSEGNVVGVVSESDIVAHLERISRAQGPGNFYSQADQEGDPPCSMVMARDLMSRNVIQASEESSAQEISRLMLRQRVHRVIITRGRKLAGIVTTTDLLRVI
ncbi:MAG: CBS domain-containing protein [Elusimicrobia bacterium]|nr:CBS domain-containing protein [Elusimicrobiota bacterium]